MKNSWIAVVEKLPELTAKRTRYGSDTRSEQVLCAIESQAAQGPKYLVKEGCYTSAGYWLIPGSQNNVIAWMPMPEFKGLKQKGE